jgi:hypothetical protein
MNKALCAILVGSILFVSNYGYNGGTTASVTLVGGIIKAKHVNQDKKYPRKNCPVCKGTGKYLSGDGIKMVDCGYCTPETKESEVTHPPAILKSDCETRVYKK